MLFCMLGQGLNQMLDELYIWKAQNTALQGTPQLYSPSVVGERLAPSSSCSVGLGSAPELSRSPPSNAIEI